MSLDQIGWLVLVAARVLPAVLLIPSFGGRRLPLSLPLAMSLCVAWSLTPESLLAEECPQGIIWYGILLKELCLGTVLAFTVSILFASLQVSGQLMDELRGASQARAHLPQTGEQTSPLAVFQVLLGCAFFFTLGGPMVLLAALGDSFVSLPVHHFPDQAVLSSLPGLVLAMCSEAFEVGIWIVLPVATAVLLADLVLGFMNRTAVQIQVFFLGMPLRALLGLLAAILCLGRTRSVILSWW